MTVSENISTGLESFSPIRIIQTSSSLRDLREFTLEGLHSFHFYEPWGESIIYIYEYEPKASSYTMRDMLSLDRNSQPVSYHGT